MTPSLAAGDVVVDRSVAVTRAMLVRYAGASGDFNPIHYSDRIAAGVGLPGVIAHGMLTMALAGQAVTEWLDSVADLRAFSVRFSKPVVVPDDDIGIEVTVQATVREVSADHDTCTLDIAVSAAGQKVLTGARATVRVPDSLRNAAAV